jgi:hypothetical protein
VPAQVGLPVLDGDFGQHLVGGPEEGRLADVDLGDLGQADAAEVVAPVEVRRQLDELRFGHRVVARLRVAELDARGGVLGEPRLDAHHGARGRRGAVGVVAEELEGARDVRDVLVANPARALVVLRVEVAVGKSQPALHGLRDDGGRVLEVLRRAEAEERGDAVRVEARDGRLDAAEVCDGGDARHLRLERLRALRLDGGLVHAGRVEVGDLLLVAPGLQVLPLREPFEDGVEVFVVLLGELLEAPPARVGRRDGVRRLPAAVGELVEVLASRGGAVEARQVEPGQRLGPRGLRLPRAVLAPHGHARRRNEHQRRRQRAQHDDATKPQRIHGPKLLIN